MVRILIPERMEADSLGALIDASFDPRYGERWSAEQIISALSMPGTLVACAFAEHDDTRPIGFALIRQVADEAELLLIAVAPDHRGKGLGGRLLDYTIEFCSASSTRDMFLEVRSGNTDAIYLYKSRGFEVVGKRPGYYRSDNGQLHDALTMHRLLVES